VTAVVALVAAACVWLWLSPGHDPAPRMRRMFAMPSPARASSPLLVPLALIAFGLGMTVLLGSLLGIALGVAAAVAFPRVTRHADGREERRRARQLARQAPEVAALLASTLAAGASTTRSIEVVAAASDPPIADVLRTVASALDLGAGPDEAWRLADPLGLLDDIAGGYRRSARSGAPLAEVLMKVASDLRRRHRQSVETAARVAGVRAIAPLAVCHLPAFLLVGAVPIVASFASGLFGS